MAMATLPCRSIYSWGLTRRVMGPEYQLLGASALFPPREGPAWLIPTSLAMEGHQDTLPQRHGRSEGSRERSQVKHDLLSSDLLSFGVRYALLD
ncbi:hypothetical protein AOLI_G00050190 [Acnodon oligacanthus]